MVTPEYVAGLVDGEGSFTLQIHETKWKDGRHGIGLNSRVQIGFSHRPKEEEVLKKVQKLLGGGKIYISNKGTDKAMIVLWTTNYDDTIKFCEMLIPHLIIKKRQAKMLLEAAKLIKKRHESRDTFMTKGTQIYSKADYTKLIEISTTMNQTTQVQRWRNAKGRNKDFYLAMLDTMYT
jgi:hypothetical protein